MCSRFSSAPAASSGREARTRARQKIRAENSIIAALTAAAPPNVNAAITVGLPGGKVCGIARPGYFTRLHIAGRGGNAMRLQFRTSVVVLLCLCATACAEQQTAALGRPNAIIVREFALNQAAITLDPTFGFSLYRGTPGVPPRQRAASVGRAVAFNVGDAIVEQLRRAGYDAVLSDGTTPEPDGRDLIVTGAFRNINEGQRRRVGAENPSLSAYGEVDYRTGSGAAVQRISNFALDSRQVAGSGGDVKATAVRLGHAIAQSVLDAARRNNWPGAAR